MRRINAVAVAGPVGLTACALLARAAARRGEDERRPDRPPDRIARGLAGAGATVVPERDPRAVLAWAAPVARIQRVPHPWGDLLVAGARTAPC